jgi:hypothetical protein
MTVPVALRNVMAAAKTFQGDNGSYEGLTPSRLAGVYDGVCYEDGYDQAGTCVDGSMLVQVAATGDRFGAAALTESNRCLLITDGPKGVRYGAGFPCTGEGAFKVTDSHFPQ